MASVTAQGRTLLRFLKADTADCRGEGIPSASDSVASLVHSNPNGRWTVIGIITLHNEIHDPTESSLCSDHDMAPVRDLWLFSLNLYLLIPV